MFSNDDCRDKFLDSTIAEHTRHSMILCVRLEYLIDQKVFMPQRWNDCLGMGMERNKNWLHGNGREWKCKQPFPVISTLNLLFSLGSETPSKTTCYCTSQVYLPGCQPDGLSKLHDCNKPWTTDQAAERCVAIGEIACIKTIPFKKLKMIF